MKIKKFRKNKSLKLKDLANNIGISTSLLSRYENDIVEPNINILKKLAQELNVSIDSLLGYDSGNLDLKMLTDNQRKLVDYVLALSPEQERQVIGYVEHMKQDKQN